MLSGLIFKNMGHTLQSLRSHYKIGDHTTTIIQQA